MIRERANVRRLDVDDMWPEAMEMHVPVMISQ